MGRAIAERARSHSQVPARRLLTLMQAASYCGLSAQAFARACPVPPISLSATAEADARLMRYDVASLDAWIDRLSGRERGDPEATDWVARAFEG